MKKIIINLFIIIFLLNHFQTVYSKELCDCYGECVQIYHRNVRIETKRMVRTKFGLSQYARVEIDHKIPLCLGGSNFIDNLQPLAKYDHKIKTEHDLYLLNNVYSCIMTIREAQNESLKWKK